jgi:predicted nucleic acid-binding protein
MIRPAERVFVDTGAWVALAEQCDPHHQRSVRFWEVMRLQGARILTSVPVALETFTFLDRRGSRELALRWSGSLQAIPRFQVLDCSPADLNEAWKLLERKGHERVSLVDATSFVLMRKEGIRVALAFDTHFATAGFRLPA